MRWKISEKFRIFECGTEKVKVRFYPFLRFYEVTENRYYIKGIITVFAYYYEDVSKWIENQNIFRIYTEDYPYYVGSSGAADYQPAFRYHIEGVDNAIFLPRSWHVTMYGKLLQEAYHIAEIEEQMLLSNCKETTGKLLRAYKSEFRIMAFTGKNSLPSNPNHQLIEHGIPFRGYVNEKLKEMRKTEDMLPFGFIKLDDSHYLQFKYDRIGENVFIIIYNEEVLHYKTMTEYRKVPFMSWKIHGHPLLYTMRGIVIKDENASVFITKKKAEPFSYWTGGIFLKGEALLFEEGQPLRKISYPRDKVHEAMELLFENERNRLDDVLFLEDYYAEQIKDLPFIGKIPWDWLEDKGITVTELKNGWKMICSQNGCISIREGMKPHELRYEIIKEVLS